MSSSLATSKHSWKGPSSLIFTDPSHCRDILHSRWVAVTCWSHSRYCHPLCCCMEIAQKSPPSSAITSNGWTYGEWLLSLFLTVFYQLAAICERTEERVLTHTPILHDQTNAKKHRLLIFKKMFLLKAF